MITEVVHSMRRLRVVSTACHTAVPEKLPLSKARDYCSEMDKVVVESAGNTLRYVPSDTTLYWHL